MKDFEDIDLNDFDDIDVQINERWAAIDRMHGEVRKLQYAAAKVKP